MNFFMNFSSVLVYTSQPYTEAMVVRPAVAYTTYDRSSKEKTGDIITFAQFEEGGLFSETHDNAERGDKSNDNSIMPPLVRKNINGCGGFRR